MNRTTVKLLLSALCLTVACDPTSQVPQQMRGESRELAPATSDEASRWMSTKPTPLPASA